MYDRPRWLFIVSIAFGSALGQVRASVGGEATHVIDSLQDPIARAETSRKGGLSLAQLKVDGRLRSSVWPVLGLAAKPQRLQKPIVQGPTAQVYVKLASTAEENVAALRNAGLGLEIVNREFSVAQGTIRLDDIPVLAVLPFVTVIRPVERGHPRVGSATTEGDHASRSDLVRSLGYDGSGVVVGVISDGIDHLGSALTTGDLAAVTVPSEPRCRVGRGDEGTAMLEIAHDLAPGAQLLFSEGLSSSLAFIDSVNCLVAAGADVIVDDIGFFTEPFFQDGSVATTVRAAVQAGVSYHSAAGNAALEHLEQQFRPSPGTGFHDFLGGPIDNTDDMTIAPGRKLTCVLQWNDPFGGSANDYDLFLFDEDRQLVDSSVGPQSGTQDPVEVVEASNPTSAPQTAKIVIRRDAGDIRLLKMFCLGGIAQEYITPSGNIVGHAAIPEAIGVAAIDVLDAALDTVESFSSRGPSVIFFPATATRDKPDLAAFDGVSISNAGGFPSCPPSCRFFGTSAAAPHSAAVAALLLSKNPFYTPSLIQDVMRRTAVDIGPAGPDTAAGFGRVDALAAIGAVPVPECFSSADCADSDPCTTDTCEIGACVHRPKNVEREGFDAVRCAFEGGLQSAACAGQSVPFAMRQRFDKARALIERAANALSTRRERKLVRKSAANLRKAARMAARAAGRGRINLDCANGLTNIVNGAEVRAERLLESLQR